jgi:hypothetical protein
MSLVCLWAPANRKPEGTGRFCANTGAKPLGLIANMSCESPLGLGTKSIRRNGSN